MFVFHLHLREAVAWVKDGEAEGYDQTHPVDSDQLFGGGFSASRGEVENSHSVQNDELDLLLHDLVPPPAGHLGNPVDAAGEQSEEGEEEGVEEQFETHVGQQRHHRWVEFGAVAVRIQSVFAREECEDNQREDLPYDTGHHQVVACGLTGRG